MIPFADWLVLVACAIAVFTDLTARRIPNVLTGGLAAAALAVHFFDGWVAVIVTIGLMAVVLIVGMSAFSLGWLGGGDVKLLAAGAGALGYPDAIGFLLYTAIGGGLIGVIALAWSGKLVTGIRNAVGIVRPLAYSGT